ncbi:MAG TPA: tetratricopeptide repeat protein [Planctomycetota bacterium]
MAAAAGMAVLAAAVSDSRRPASGLSVAFVADPVKEAKCALVDREPARAERLLKEHLERHDDPAARALLGRVLLELGRADAARALFTSLVEKRPEDVEALRGLAAACQAQGQTDLALIYAHRAADLRPKDAGLWRDLALAQRAGGDVLGALSSAQQGLAADPDRQDLRELVASLAQSDARPRMPGMASAALRAPGAPDLPDPLRRVEPPDLRRGALLSPVPSGRRP